MYIHFYHYIDYKFFIDLFLIATCIISFLCFSWYFGTLSREETNEILNPTESGVFLVRDSQSIKGDFVLCVK